MAYYMMFDEECPIGWTKKTVDDGRFVYGTNVSIDTTGGVTSVQHRHNFTGVSGYWTSGAFGYYQTNYYVAYATVGILPAGYQMILCSPNDATTWDGLPQKSVIISDDATCPRGYSEYSSGLSKFVYLTETDANAGSSVGGNTGSHTHTVGGTLSYTTGGYGQSLSSDPLITAYTQLYHHKLLLCKRD